MIFPRNLIKESLFAHPQRLKSQHHRIPAQSLPVICEQKGATYRDVSPRPVVGGHPPCDDAQRDPHHEVGRPQQSE